MWRLTPVPRGWFGAPALPFTPSECRDTNFADSEGFARIPSTQRERGRDDMTVADLQVAEVDTSTVEAGSPASQAAIIAEAIAVIDRTLSQLVRREIVSAGEISDLLLDVRNVLGRA